MPSSKKSTKKTSKKSSKKTSTETQTKTIDITKMKRDTRLISIDEWDWDRVVYSDPQKIENPDGSGYFRRVKINYMYDNETIGPAIVGLDKHYCYGVQADNVDKDGNVYTEKDTGLPKKLGGYKVPIVLTGQNKNTPDATPEEQTVVDFFDSWQAEVLRYATENKKKIGKGAKKDSQIDGMVSDILYRKKDGEGNIEDNVSPKLYAKLIYYRNDAKIGTPFYGPGDSNMNPLKLTSHFNIYANIRFDNIYIGGKSISLQHRIYDATVEPIARAPVKRLARKNKMDPEEAKNFNTKDSDDDDEEATGDSSTNANNMMESESEDEAEVEEEEDEEEEVNYDSD